MRLKPLKLGHLTADIPIIQGGMGVGISLSGLSGAVASSGAVGVISSAQIGFADSGFDLNPLKTNLKALANQINLAKEKAKQGIIGVNIMAVTNKYEEYVKQAVESKADLIISGAGLPINLPDLVKNSKTLIAPIVSSLKAAKVLLTTWERRFQATADFLVVEGPKAGGHLGFKPEQLEQEEDFDPELGRIIDFIKSVEEKFKKNIPVIFGGGISDRNSFLHYLNMGCQGIQVATPFVATEECDAHPDYKQAYIDAKKEDICIIKSPVGLPGRAIRNNFIQNIGEGKALGRCNQCISKCKRPDIPYCISDRLIRAVRGDVKNGLVFCGQNAYRLTEIKTVKEVLDSYTESQGS